MYKNNKDLNKEEEVIQGDIHKVNEVYTTIQARISMKIGNI